MVRSVAGAGAVVKEKRTIMSSLQKKQKKPSKTDNTNGQQKPWLFQPGQSGNPAGRPRGARNKLADDFLTDTYAQWQQHGSTALETMAKTEPAKFCQMVANLVPKETLLPDEGRVQISEIKLVIIDAARDRVIEHNDTTRDPVLIEDKRD
jgi:hypothetical protein